jgi:glycosyltransferase involved in cell wall biosynthesis
MDQPAHSAGNARPLVSIVVAVRNGGRRLQRCIDSVRTQTDPSHELIVMDGGSSDGTVDLLKANRDTVTYWESAPDRGIYHAWNKAVARARGQWICFLGAEDFLWQPDAIERWRPHLERALPDHSFVYGSLAVVSRRGETVSVIDQPWTQARHRFFTAMSVPHPGALHHRSLFDAHGPFDESFSIAADYDLLLRAFRERPPLYVPGIIQAGWEEGGITTRLSAGATIVRERRRALVKNGIRVPPTRAAWMYVEEFGRLALRRFLGETAMRRVQAIYRGWTQRPGTGTIERSSTGAAQ